MALLPGLSTKKQHPAAFNDASALQRSKSVGRSFVPLVTVFLLLLKDELLALSDCVELFTKPWSSTVNDLYVWLLIARVVIDLICHLPRISYEEAGNQSL